MESLAKGHQVPEDNVILTITEREVMLLDLCLKLVAQHYAQKSTLSFEVQRLRHKLPVQQRAPDDSATGTKNGNQIQKGSKSNKK